MQLPLVLAVISLVLCVAFFFYFRRYVDRKTSADRFLADYRTEVYRLIAEIDAVTDRNLRLMEDSVKSLKQLLEDTDKRISVYTRELERSRQGEAMYASLGRGIRAALDSSSPVEPSSLVETPSPPETSSPQEPPPEAVPSAETLHRGSAEPRFPSANERRRKKNREKMPPNISDGEIPGQNVSSKRKLKVRIAEMSARGLTPQEIASRLNLSVTEVDLALNLLQRPGN
jgi:hypothetical protein